MSRSAGADATARPRRAAPVVAAATIALVAWAASASPRDTHAKGVAPALPPATNPTTADRVRLGETLFTDVRLSVDDRLACATCHVAELGFTDGLARAHGHRGKELARNSPSLLNVGQLSSFFWDGRAPSLEEQARVPILNPDEMAMPDAAAVARKLAAIPEYPPLFEKAFGDPAITLQRVARALAAFERTLVAGDSPFDRWWRGDAAAMDAAAQRGYSLFVHRAGCAQCHSIRQSYATFTDGDFHNTGAGSGDGLRDRGRAAVTGRPEDEGAFRTPTLRNVALTAPYMHDGSLATLEAVVDFYVEGGRANPHLSPLVRPLDLTDADRVDLVAFLKALTSAKLPGLEECDRLLAEGRPREALDAFLRDLDERGGGDRALLGAARAARALGEKPALSDVERRLRRRLAEASPDRTHDADPAVGALIEALADVTLALAPLEEAMALAREDDALLLWRRLRAAVPARDDVALREADFLDRRDRADEALAALDGRTSDAAALARAGILYRRGWRAFSAGAPTDAARGDLRAAADALDRLRAAGAPLDAESLVYRATARHWLGEIEPARAVYLDAAADEAAAERALRGLRNLLANDLPRYRADLAAVLAARPDSPAALYVGGWEALEQGDLDAAERLLRRRLEVETSAAPGPVVLLARVERRRGLRDEALGHYCVGLALDARFPGLVTEIETYLRERPLRGFDDVRALTTEYRRFLEAGPDDARFQAVTRNNLAFLLRDVAASYTSRGPARLHEFAVGAPPEARETLRLAVALYEEAAAMVPDDVADLPFRERWIWAGVLNDCGLMRHYFAETRDLARAESCYLRAFELTDGAYMDAYFYNLQFLYGFELDGRDERWLELAARAKDAILREDPASPTGFSPDPMKRAAALRDWERLTAKLRR